MSKSKHSLKSNGSKHTKQLGMDTVFNSTMVHEMLMAFLPNMKAAGIGI